MRTDRSKNEALTPLESPQEEKLAQALAANIDSTEQFSEVAEELRQGLCLKIRIENENSASEMERAAYEAVCILEFSKLQQSLRASIEEALAGWNIDPLSEQQIDQIMQRVQAIVSERGAQSRRAEFHVVPDKKIKEREKLSLNERFQQVCGFLSDQFVGCLTPETQQKFATKIELFTNLQQPERAEECVEFLELVRSVYEKIIDTGISIDHFGNQLQKIVNLEERAGTRFLSGLNVLDLDLSGAILFLKNLESDEIFLAAQKRLDQEKSREEQMIVGVAEYLESIGFERRREVFLYKGKKLPPGQKMQCSVFGNPINGRISIVFVLSQGQGNLHKESVIALDSQSKDEPLKATEVGKQLRDTLPAEITGILPELGIISTEKPQGQLSKEQQKEELMGVLFPFFQRLLDTHLPIFSAGNIGARLEYSLERNANESIAIRFSVHDTSLDPQRLSERLILQEEYVFAVEDYMPFLDRRNIQEISSPNVDQYKIAEKQAEGNALYQQCSITFSSIFKSLEDFISNARQYAGILQLLKEQQKLDIPENLLEMIHLVDETNISLEEMQLIVIALRRTLSNVRENLEKTDVFFIPSLEEIFAELETLIQKQGSEDQKEQELQRFAARLNSFLRMVFIENDIEIGTSETLIRDFWSDRFSENIILVLISAEISKRRLNQAADQYVLEKDSEKITVSVSTDRVENDEVQITIAGKVAVFTPLQIGVDDSFQKEEKRKAARIAMEIILEEKQIPTAAAIRQKM